MEILGARPGRRVVVYFLSAVMVGSVLLSLPISSTGDGIGVVNALFTATSAVCVTGLTVVSTGHDLSLFGQVVVLVLIQLGGLGIMTFATALLASLGGGLSFYNRLGLSQSLGSGNGGSVRPLLLAVFVTAVLCELTGAVLLFLRFSSQFPPAQAAFHSVFHSVSAFCNAGFSTFDSSLEAYSLDYFTLGVFSVLIIAGGLGFVVIRELYDWVKNRKTRLSLHSKLCLSTSAVLLLIGTAAFMLADYHNVFSAMGPGHSLLNAFFQSVTSRTAGFNAIPQTNLTEVSVLLTMILMFIGGCPGSTAGGIKATTMAVIFLLVLKRFAGKEHVNVFKRSISSDSIARALAVFLLSCILILIIFSLLMFLEEKPVPHKLSFAWFVDALFETISAFGTVGLSLGVTTHLHDPGKVLLTVMMFVGRLGPLTLAFAMARSLKRGEIVYVEEEVMVG